MAAVRQNPGALSQGPMYPSLFKRSSTSPRKSTGAAALRQLPPMGGAAEVIANARQHLDRARLHLNLPPLAPVELGPARVAPPESFAAAAAAPGGSTADDAESAERRKQLRTKLDAQIRELAAAVGDDLASYRPVAVGANGGDETAAFMAQMLNFLQSSALRPKPPAAVDNSAFEAQVAEANAALQAEQERRAGAEQQLADATSTNAAALESVGKSLEEETSRKVALEEELAEARGALAAGSDAGAMLAAEQAESQAAKETAAQQATRITELEATLEEEKAKVVAAEASASAAAAAAAAAEDQHADADDVLIKWLSMHEGRELLVEMVGLGAHEALVQRECDGDDDQARLMDAARETASDDDSIPGTGMLHTVVKSVCDVALGIQETKSAPGISIVSEQVTSLRTELADAAQREEELRARQEEDAAELNRLREQIAATEGKAKAMAEEAAAAQAKAAELEAAPAKDPPPPAPVQAGSADDEYLDTIPNEQARAWWRTYIGSRAATYNAVQDATTAWMLKVDSTMTQAEASIVAATVCFGIDRDGDGEITYAEFGKFSEDLGNEYSVAKLRQYEVARKEDTVDEQKLHEYAEYLGIDANTEDHILWIAKRCMNAPLPKGWKEFTDDQGQSYFHNDSKQETSWDHPLDGHVRKPQADSQLAPPLFIASFHRPHPLTRDPNVGLLGSS
jgi:predicted nuclease with TOPRIM domain